MLVHGTRVLLLNRERGGKLFSTSTYLCIIQKRKKKESRNTKEEKERNNKRWIVYSRSIGESLAVSSLSVRAYRQQGPMVESKKGDPRFILSWLRKAKSDEPLE